MIADWLSQLAPTQTPPPPGWWPLAPGWWGLALLLGLIAAGLVYRGRRPPVRLRRTALRELKRLEGYMNDDARLAGELEHLMRRYAVAAYGRGAGARRGGAAGRGGGGARGGGGRAG